MPHLHFRWQYSFTQILISQAKKGLFTGCSKYREIPPHSACDHVKGTLKLEIMAERRRHKKRIQVPNSRNNCRNVLNLWSLFGIVSFFECAFCSRWNTVVLSSVIFAVVSYMGGGLFIRVGAIFAPLFGNSVCLWLVSKHVNTYSMDLMWAWAYLNISPLWRVCLVAQLMELAILARHWLFLLLTSCCLSCFIYLTKYRQ